MNADTIFFFAWLAVVAALIGNLAWRELRGVGR